MQLGSGLCNLSFLSSDFHGLGEYQPMKCGKLESRLRRKMTLVILSARAFSLAQSVVETCLKNLKEKKKPIKVISCGF